MRENLRLPGYLLNYKGKKYDSKRSNIAFYP